ncbi:MAG: hypothetical protein H7318_13435 [Oligoflexus sp.]|nr:hypothetical protein [Oligoflexus sp.]
MFKTLPSRVFLLALTVGSFLAAEIVAAPRKAPAESRSTAKSTSAKFIQVPQTAGVGEIMSADRSVKASEGPRVDFAKNSNPSAKSVPSAYTMDGSKQVKAYEFVSIPVGGWSGSDNLNKTSPSSK